MTNWIKQPGRQEWTEYALCFDNIEHPSSGFMFDCDKDGNVIMDPQYPQRAANLGACRAEVGKTLSAPYIRTSERSYYDPGSVRCDCGREHHLQHGDSVCDCGQYYNACGQQLNPPHMWEEAWEED